MKKQSANLTYTPCGDYLIPDIAISVAATENIGKYGRMRKKYLMSKLGTAKQGPYQNGEKVSGFMRHSLSNSVTPDNVHRSPVSVAFFKIV